MKFEKKIVRLFSRLNVGGPALHVVNLTAGLEDYNYETVLVVGTPDDFEGSMAGYATQKGVTPRFIKEFQAAISPLKDLIAFIKIFWLIRKEKPQIVHTHTFKAGLLGRIAAKLNGTPLIVHTYHGHLLQGYWGKTTTYLVTRVEALLANWTNMIIAVSETVAKDLIESKIVAASKIKVVGLGFDLELLQTQLSHPSTLRAQFDIPKQSIVVGIVGRLVPIKAVDLFLKALQPLLVDANIHLAIIGGGPERESLEKLADELCAEKPILRSQIHFCGWRLPVANEYKDLDICVCTSKNEGTAVAIIEAVMAGVPVVSTRVGGMPDLLEHGRHGLLAESTAESVREAVQTLIDTLKLPEENLKRVLLNEQLADSKNVFLQKFGVKRLTHEIDDLYKSVLAERAF